MSSHNLKCQGNTPKLSQMSSDPNPEHFESTSLSVCHLLSPIFLVFSIVCLPNPASLPPSNIPASHK